MRKLWSEYRQQNTLRAVRKADILLIFGCLLAALLLGFFLAVYRREGRVVHISCDGEELRQIDLGGEDISGRTQYYLIRYTGGTEAQILCSDDYPELSAEQSYNLFSISDGIVTMEAADCRDQICVRHKSIAGSGESVICLPHRLVIEIDGGESAGAAEALDGYTGGSSSGMPGEPADGTLDGVVR